MGTDTMPKTCDEYDGTTFISVRDSAWRGKIW